MIPQIVGLAVKFKPYLIGAGVIAVVLLGVAYEIYAAGMQRVENKVLHEELKDAHDREQQHKKIHDVDVSIRSLPADDARKRLLRDWLRK